MDKLYKFFADWRLTILFLILVLFFSLYLFPTDSTNYAAPDKPRHVNLQMQYEKEKFTEMIISWEEVDRSLETAVRNYRVHLLKLDIIFPILYVLSLMSAIAALTDVTRGKPKTWAIILFLLPIGAGLCDITENIIHINLLKDVKIVSDLLAIPENPIRISFIFTITKYILILIPLLSAIGFRIYWVAFRNSAES
jgi:hypothetical protein